MKKYYGWNDAEQRVMFAEITGEMVDGTKVYTEVDSRGNRINNDRQYIRTLKYGTQLFIGI